MQAHFAHIFHNPEQIRKKICINSGDQLYFLYQLYRNYPVTCAAEESIDADL